MRILSFFIESSRHLSSKSKLKNYILPEILIRDCKKKLISGWGPGGSRVNAQKNAVMLKHIPTGLVVKVHDSRSVYDNEKIAHERLKHKVDREINGENCYDEQLKRLEANRVANLNRKKAAYRRQKKETQAFKEDMITIE